jgi:hypothetical protein
MLEFEILNRYNLKWYIQFFGQYTVKISNYLDIRT